MCTLPLYGALCMPGLPSLQTDQAGPLQHQLPDRRGDGCSLLDVENGIGDLEHPGLGQPALGPKLLQIELLGGQGRGPGGQQENGRAAEDCAAARSPPDGALARTGAQIGDWECRPGALSW